MWSISKQVYGTGAFFRALVEYNRDQIPTPERLAIGVQVATPTEDALRATYPNLCPRPHKGPATRRQAAPVGDLAVPTGGRKYLAEEGDTLSVIARYELGDVNRWSEIYQLNHALLGDDPNSLRPGTWLVLPAAASRDSLVRRPNPPAGQ